MRCSSCQKITLKATHTCPKCGAALPGAEFSAAMQRAEEKLRLSRPSEAELELVHAEAELQRTALAVAQPIAKARLRSSQARVLFYKSHYMQALAAAHEVISLLDDAAELALLRAEAFCTLANIAQFQDDLRTAERYAAQALYEAQAAADSFTLGLTLNAKGNIAWHSGDLAYAIALYQQGLRCAQQAETLGLAAAICGNMAGIYQERGEMRQALEFVTKALRLAEQAGDELRETYALATLGHIYINLGEYSEADAFLQRAQRLAEHHGNMSMAANITVSLAELAWLQGSYTAGAALAAQVIKMAEEDPRERTLAYATQVHCALGQGDLAQAQQAYAKMLAERKAHNIHHTNDYYYLTLTAGAALKVAEGEWHTAQAEFEAAVPQADAEGDVHTQAQVRIIYAQALLTQTSDVGERARTLLAEAKHIFARSGAMQNVRRVKMLAASLPQ